MSKVRRKSSMRAVASDCGKLHKHKCTQYSLRVQRQRIYETFHHASYEYSTALGCLAQTEF